MGAVYLAEHPLIGKKVALKVIHKDLAMSRDVVDRFFQEARAVTKIGHEHIVEIHDFGVTADGDHFYIMEYLEGKTLASVLGHEGRFEVIRALHVGAQIASALAAAHAAGVIHRDLKPDNVMLIHRLGDPDFVKLLDFGLAKMAAADGSAVKTAAGVLLGTPQYMSPEACETRGIDHRTDVYALGILLFQMMTGTLPFDGESMGEILVKQVTQLPPAPRAINPSIPPSVEQIVLRCLMKQADARFATMAVLREALLDPEAYLRTSPPISPARSLAPGQVPVDAKTVIAFAAAQQAQRMGAPAAHARTAVGIAGALPAPAPSMVGGGNVAAARTMIAGRTIGRAPEMVEPSPPKMNTMRIATPVGYSSRPPRRMWPVVIVVGLLLGRAGGAVAVAVLGRSKGQKGQTGEKGEMGENGGKGSVVDAPVAAPVVAAQKGSAEQGSASEPAGSAGSASEAPVMATVEIDSVPPGANVTRDGKVLGQTPLKLELPVSASAVEIRIERAGFHARTEQVVVKGNLVLQVPLEAIAAPHHARPPVHHHQKPVGDTGLMSPDDM